MTSFRVSLRVMAGMLILLLQGAIARGQATLRMASIVPEGTAFAREFHALARNIESATAGQVKMKWYLGAMAGDEDTALARVRRGQLDGLAGAVFCEKLAPSLAVIHVLGLFENRDEVAYVLGRLKPTLDEEMRQAGFSNLADSVVGADVFFSRKPLRSMADLRNLRTWVWARSPIYLQMAADLGMHPVPAAIDDLGRLYRSGEIDGFMAPASAALAFQWSTLASFFTPIESAMLPGCLVISNQAIDPLPLSQQTQVRTAAAHFLQRWNDITATLDAELLGRLFAKQGLKRVDVSPELRREFFADTKSIRSKLSDQLVRRELVERVETLLDEYHAQRRE